MINNANKTNLHMRFNKTAIINISIIMMVFSLVFIVYIGKRNHQFGDSMWVTYTAMSIAIEGNTDLDEYKDLIEKNDYFAIQKVGEHFYYRFPIGTSIMSLPIISALASSSEGFSENFHYDMSTASKFDVVIAASIVALTAMFIYLIASLYLNKRYSLLLVFIFAFCTSAWSVASRSLWQHGPSMLMLTIALYLILLARNKPKLIQYVSLPLAFSYLVRPTNSISIAFLTIYVLIEYRTFFIRYILWSLPVLLAFVLYNYSVYGTLLPWYYKSSRLFTNPNFFEAIAGNLISPARGIFVFSPVLLFSILAVVLKAKDRKLIKLDYIVIMIILVHLFVISSHVDWWGGWSFGNRFFSDMTPYFMYLLIPFLIRISSYSLVKKSIMFPMLFLLLLFSFFVNFRGATEPETWIWNDRMNLAHVENPKLWDWGDLQFLAGL